MSCGVGCRHGSDPALLWLWCRPVAAAPIGLLAWEHPYAAGAALEKAKKDQKKKNFFVLIIYPDSCAYLLINCVSNPFKMLVTNEI